MAISCPNCKQVFDNESSYQNHLPCSSATRGGKEDLRKGKFEEGEAGPGIGGQD